MHLLFTAGGRTRDIYCTPYSAPAAPRSAVRQCICRQALRVEWLDTWVLHIAGVAGNVLVLPGFSVPSSVVVVGVRGVRVQELLGAHDGRVYLASCDTVR